MKTLFALFLWALSIVVHAQEAGRIERVEGEARIYDKARTVRGAVVGEAVAEGDTIVTGPSGEVHLAMTDEGQIAIRPDTRLTIARYRADGGSSDTSIFSLVQGALRSVTGWIGKYNPKGYAIRTPTATIGVRGTDHETMVVAQGGEGEPGTYDKVNHGETLLTTKYGQTVVRPSQAGFAAISGRSAPRVLASVPRFFRPAKLDAQFQSLHDKVRQRIDTRRSARIEKLRTQRLKPDGSQRGREQLHERQGPERHGTSHGEGRRERLEQRQHERQRQFDERRGSSGEGHQLRPPRDDDGPLLRHGGEARHHGRNH